MFKHFNPHSHAGSDAGDASYVEISADIWHSFIGSRHDLPHHSNLQIELIRLQMTGNSKPLPNDSDTKLRQFLLLFGRQKAIPTHLINSFAASTQKMGHSVEIFFLVKIKLPVTHFYLFAKCSIVSFKSSLKLFSSSSVMVPSPSRDIILKKRFDLFISH